MPHEFLIGCALWGMNDDWPHQARFAMAFLDEECTGCTKVAWEYLRTVCGLRAAPRHLLAICALQLLVLGWGLLQHLHPTQCLVSIPPSGELLIDCATCRVVSLGMQAFLIHLGGFAVIACGVLAVHWRDQKLLYIYGTCMLFFALVIGMTAMLTAAEAPTLEVAMEGVQDPACLQMAEAMILGARDQAFAASIGCLIDTAGAIFAIRSKELFNYEEIATAHAEIANAQPL